MRKRLLQDMVQKKRPLGRAHSAQAVKKEIVLENPPLLVKTPVQNVMHSVHNVAGGGDKKRSRYSYWLVAAVSLVFFFFAVSYLFLKVTVTVNPKMQDVVLNENLSASRNGAVGTLSFDSIVLSGEEDKVVETTEEKDVSEKAEGVVIIYNAYGYSPQRLSIDTRLLGSNGKIYKTKKAVIVPGMKSSSIPGSVEASVYAETAGTEYNSVPLDFTILGFKGTSKYDKFYARSNINDTVTKGKISGGFKGKFPSLSEGEKTNILNEMTASLKATLLKRATDQIPGGFILFKDAVVFNMDGNNVDFASTHDKTLSLKIKGTLSGILFNEESLTKKIATDTISKYEGSPVYIPNIQDLTFSPGGAGILNQDNASTGEMKNINFNLKGNTKIVWLLDESKLASDLLGKSKKDFNQVLLSYPNIESADLVISPFWKTSLPDKTKDIKVIVNYPK